MNRGKRLSNVLALVFCGGGVLVQSVALSAQVSDVATMTRGGYNTGGGNVLVSLKGYSSLAPVFGSYAPTVLTGGNIVNGLQDFGQCTNPGQSYPPPTCPAPYPVISNPLRGTLSVGGFTTDPGVGWLVSVTAGGVTRTGAAAAYSYSSGSALWTWNGAAGLFGFSNSGTISVTITHVATDVQGPSAPTNLTATVVSGTQINLNWVAATDNVAVTGYRVERCTGVSCTTFAQVATPTVITYSDVGLVSATSYSYRVRAVDAAGNLGAYSSTVSATTLDTVAPSAPSGLTATAVTSAQINLAWTAATDNVAVTGYRIERCSGTGCTAFVQLSTSATPNYRDSGLSVSTAYSYRVRATDAAGNVGAYSATASATTPAATPSLATWQSLRTALAIGNVTTSMSLLTLSAQNIYGAALAALAQTSGGSPMVNGWSQPTLVYSDPEIAEYIVTQSETGVTKSHIVTVVLQDGVWLVESF
jgi:chitodextrinase